MKRLLSLLVCVCMLFCGCTLMAGAQTADVAPSGEFVPVLRFVAASDTHLRDENDFTAPRIGQMMQTAYALAKEDSHYSRVDALLIAGDVTNDGTKSEFLKLQDTVNAALDEQTAFLAVAAKNHDGYHLKRSVERDIIASITGNDADFHVVINGYHFIGISVSSHKSKHYDDEQKAWLKKQLDAATAEDAGKPVFVMQHEHPKDTVYGSSGFERWYTAQFNEIFEQYPQIVDFSGHSHYPLNHPNSVWQGAYTAIGTGAVKSTDYTVEDMRDIATSPENRNCSSYWIVEVDAANRLRLRGMDLLAGKMLCEYILDNPADPANRSFSTENKAAASTAPVFPEGTVLSVSASRGSCTATVTQAESTDGMPVVLYRAYAQNANGKVIAETWTQPQYYLADAPDTVELTLKGLGKGNYTICVVAETAYGVQSEALQSEVQVISPNDFFAFFSRIGLRIAHYFEWLWNAIV